MSAQYLTLNEPRYVPKYNTLDTNLINTVDTEIQKQGQFNTDAASKMFGNLQEQVIGGLSGLDQEFQAEAAGLVDQSRANIDRVFEEKGARHAMPSIQKEAERISGELRPYQQVAGESQAYQKRIHEVGAENNVNSRVRQYFLSQGKVERDESGALKFTHPDTSILDNWRDLHEVARISIKDVESIVTESGVFLDPEDQAFYQRIKRTYRDIDRLQSVGVNRIISDREAIEQMRITLEADGYIFQDSLVYTRDDNGELQNITIKKEGAEYNLTEADAMIEEATKISAPTASARALERQEFSYTSKNPLYFSALANDGNNGFISIPRSTVAGRQAVNNPFELDTSIKNSYEDYNKMISSLEEQKIIQITSSEGLPEYTVLDEGRYNSRRSNLSGLRNNIVDQENRRERLQIMAFQEFSEEPVTPENLDEFKYAIREGSNEFNQMSQELKMSMVQSTPLKESIDILRRTSLGNKSASEILELAISGIDLRTEFRLDSDLNDKRLTQVQDYFSQIKERYKSQMDNQLLRLSPEYKKYADLLKEDSKGRIVELPVIHSTNDDIYKIANRAMNNLISGSTARSSSNDIKWLDTDKAHESIFERGDDEDIESYEFAGFTNHPDTSESLALYAAIGKDKKSQGIVYIPATKSFAGLIPVNNQYAKENWYNTMVNSIASSGSRSGRLKLMLDDIEEEIGRPIDINLHIDTPVRTATQEGVPLIRGSHSEIVITVNRGGNETIHTFDPNTNDAVMFITQLENKTRQALLREHRGQ